MICVILLMGGLQLFSLGVLGEYLAKTYIESKDRPIYVVFKPSGDRQDGVQDRHDRQSDDRGDGQ